MAKYGAFSEAEATSLAVSLSLMLSEQGGNAHIVDGIFDKLALSRPLTPFERQYCAASVEVALDVIRRKDCRASEYIGVQFPMLERNYLLFQQLLPKLRA